MKARIIEWRSDSASLGPAVVAMGVFDGVHVGHQTLIKEAVGVAEERSVSSAVLTFDRDPDQVVTPDLAAPQLLTLEDKLAFIGELGVETILVVPFCVHMAEKVPGRFLDEVLIATFEPAAVVVGADFRFGRRASGTLDTLREWGGRHGFDVLGHELVSVGGMPVTSTRVRALVAAGRVDAAAELLGRAHRAYGRVVHGRGVGASLLHVPTANIAPWNHTALPAPGVYAGAVNTGDDRRRAAISVGRPPSFPDARDVLEAHLLDFEGDLYGTDVTLEFGRRLRDQRAFANPEDLEAQLHADIELVREASGA